MNRASGTLQVLSAAVFAGLELAAARVSLPVAAFLSLAAVAPSAVADSGGGRNGGQGDEGGQGGTSRDCGTSSSGVDSDPVQVHNPDFGYQWLAVGVPGQADYEAYRRSNRGRRKMLYVGAGDGRLHAFDATTGNGRFILVPPGLSPEASAATPANAAPENYQVPPNHRGGMPGVGDAYIRGGWKTVLIGSPGTRGRTIFALDVTDPDALSRDALLWQRTRTELPHLGHLLRAGAIARMQDGTWAAVFGNGYRSAEGRAVLYILELSNGALLAELDTRAGSSQAPNGLAAPALLVDDNRTVIAAYAGDVHGNLWKFDLSATDPGRWGVAYGPRAAPRPLFRALDDEGRAQPITQEPEIGLHPTGVGYLIYFGTGDSGAGGYPLAGDAGPGPVSSVQTFYGIWDRAADAQGEIPSGRDRLRRQRITQEVRIGGSQWRLVSDKDPNWAIHRGWFVALVSPTAGAQGERTVGTPRLRNGRIIFTSLIPTDPRCESEGSGWVMALRAENGGRVETGVFDVDGDGTLTDADRVAGKASGADTQEKPRIIRVGTARYRYRGNPDAAGGTDEIGTTQASGASRKSWRQLR